LYGLAFTRSNVQPCIDAGIRDNNFKRKMHVFAIANKRIRLSDWGKIQNVLTIHSVLKFPQLQRLLLSMIRTDGMSKQECKTIYSIETFNILTWCFQRLDRISTCYQNIIKVPNSMSADIFNWKNEVEIYHKFFPLYSTFTISYNELKLEAKFTFLIFSK
jgi:hypothetical protein